MHWTRALLVATAMFGGSAASAQDAEVLQSFTRADLKEALVANGATHEDAETGRNISITFNGGIRGDGLLLACEDEETERGCYGTSLLATFSAKEGTSPEAVTAAINEYNYRENFGRAYMSPDGTISVRLYIISDGGITKENYARQIGLWVASLEDFFGYLYGEEEENT
ncbi:MAG: YbjN domain-containing protein [Pseudomonadota bacterium]